MFLILSQWIKVCKQQNPYRFRKVNIQISKIKSNWLKINPPQDIFLYFLLDFVYTYLILFNEREKFIYFKKF